MWGPGHPCAGRVGARGTGMGFQSPLRGPDKSRLGPKLPSFQLNAPLVLSLSKFPPSLLPTGRSCCHPWGRGQGPREGWEHEGGAGRVRAGRALSGVTESLGRGQSYQLRSNEQRPARRAPPYRDCSSPRPCHCIIQWSRDGTVPVSHLGKPRLREVTDLGFECALGLSALSARFQLLAPAVTGHSLHLCKSDPRGLELGTIEERLFLKA